MKTFVLYLSLAIFMTQVQCAHAQERKKGTYRLWVELLNSKEVVKGELLELKDSVISVRIWESEEVKHVGVTQIKRMKFRRKGAVGKGVGIGAGSGLVLGVIIGQSSGDDDPGFFSLTAEEKSFVNSVGLVPLGAAVGGVIGSSRKKFLINGLKSNYDELKPEMSRYAQVTVFNK